MKQINATTPYILPSVNRALVVISIAMMGTSSLLTLAKTAAPPLLFLRRNHRALAAASSNNKSRGRRSARRSYEPKRTPARLERNELYRDPRFSFIPTFAFSERSSPASRTEVRSPSPSRWLRPSRVRASPHGDSNFSRRASSSIASCALATGKTDARTTTDEEEFGSREIIIPPGTTIRDVLRISMRLLEDRSVPEPDESVLHLLSHALELSWEDGYRRLREVSALPSTPISNAHNGPILDLARRTLTSEQSATFRSLLERRLEFEPLQYIVGRWDFHRLTGLIIRKPMLCPRPETEELVELVSSDVARLITRADGRRKIRILDVGCGTGAIGIALAHSYPKHVEVVALDVLPEAVELANENADKFLSGFVGDIVDAKEGAGSLYQAIVCSAMDFTNDPIEHADTEGASNAEQKYKMNFDIVVSNPPYIPAKDMLDLSADVVGHEDHGALCGGDDGLDVVREIIRRFPEWVAAPTATGAAGSRGEGGSGRRCWMEVDDSHPSALAEWLAPGSQESIRSSVEFRDGRKDFCGRDRFVLLANV